MKVVSGRRRLFALGLALAADAVQWLLLPLVAEGALSPLELALDLGMAAGLTRLIGFHWSYLPAFGLEALPFVDLAPTWTASVLLATRQAKQPGSSGGEAAKSGDIDAQRRRDQGQ